MRFAANRRGPSRNGRQTAGLRRSVGLPAHGKHPVWPVCLARRPGPGVQSIFLANLHAVKLAESPLRMGCGGIETAADGTFAAMVHGFPKRPPKQGVEGAPMPRPRACGAHHAPRTCAGRPCVG